MGAIESRPRALVWLRIALVIALLGPPLLLAYVGWSSHTEATQAARGRLARLAQIAQEQAQRIVETNEVISRAVATTIANRSNDELRAGRDGLHAALQSWTAGLPQLQSVWIWDESGRPIATNLRPGPPADLDVSDREYFVWARDTQSAGWYVSQPLRSRTTGQLFFDFSKRRSTADGAFAGVISVSLLPAYFDDFFGEQVRNAPGFTLSLFRSDGTVISRYPGTPSAGGGKLGPSSPLLARMTEQSASGGHAGVSTLDGEYRYVAYRRIGDLPLYAVATASRSAVLEPWRRSMQLLALFTVPLALALAGACWFAMRRVRREHAIALAHQDQYEQRLNAEEALRHAQKMEALGRLTGGVAHDFNNLLMVVQSSVTLARQFEARGQPVGRALAPIERAVANGAQLTRQLLAVVRRQPLQVRTVRLSEVIPALAQLMTSTLGRTVKVTHDVDERLRVTVDQAELELALINLCINAKDAMPGGGSIRLEAHEAQPPADAVPLAPWVRIRVCDDGEGMAPEVLARVTEPFFTTKPLGKGTGLGLNQVQSFVSQAGGRLQIDSQPGAGTQVSILLPFSVTQEDAGAADSGGLEALEGAVLVVEDNTDIAESVIAILQNAGADVTWHASADAAWQALQAGARFDAVLSDVSLPGEMNGIDLARRLSSAARPLPVVLMTGYTDRLQEANAAGFRVIPKPASAGTLIRAIVDAMRSQATA